MIYYVIDVTLITYVVMLISSQIYLFIVKLLINLIYK